MNEEQKKKIFEPGTSWKYILAAVVVIGIAYVIGTALFGFFPALQPAMESMQKP